jgi:signal transduction histidine kinase/CheY-like chemotaxis protein
MPKATDKRKRTAQARRPKQAPIAKRAGRKPSNRELEQSRRELALLSGAVQMINSSLDLDRVLVAILEAVRQMLQVEICSIWLVDPATGELVCRSSAGPHAEVVRGWRLRAGQGLVGWVAQNGSSLVVADALVDPRHHQGVDRQTGQPLRSILGIPLRVRGTVAGVLQLADPVVGCLKSDDLPLVESIAATAAIAIENARLYTEAQREIDERKRTGEALRQAKEAAESANRAKSEFVSKMSHEIRTPIHGIMGLTSLLLDTPLTNEQLQSLKMIQSSSTSLLGIVNDILDFSKIEARRMELQESDFNLATVVQQAVDTIALSAHNKGVGIVLDIPAQVPSALVGDARRLIQVLINLLANALKFTDAGEIALSVQADGETGRPGDKGTRRQGDLSTCVPVSLFTCLRFSVHDTGIGIPPDKLPLLFEAFYQADGSAARKYNGTGLGLTISKQLVELMGGQIHVTSEVGKGSTFCFSVPFKRQPALAISTDGLPGRQAVQRPALVVPAHPLWILVAEDNLTSQFLACKMLEKTGHSIRVANNGLQVVELWKNESFDLILMDVEMPEMDGLEATRLIRQAEAKTGRHIPILAVTAYAMKQDQERCLAAGADGVLTKPFDPAKLAETLAGLREQKKPVHSPASVDLEAALASTGGDRELLLQAVELFLQRDYPRQMSQVDMGIAERDGEAVRKAAHGLKGALEGIGGLPARDAARRLEMIGREGDWRQAQAARDELESEITRLRAFFEGVSRTDEAGLAPNQSSARS